MFWKIRQKKQPSYKRQPKTLKQILSDAFTKELNKNPELMQKISIKHGAKELGIEFETKDPVEEQKLQIRAKIIERALKKIDTDPELAEQFVETQIGEIMGEGKDRGGRYEDYGYSEPGSTIRQALQELEDVEEFRDRLGGNKGAGPGGIITESTVTEFIKLVRSMIGKDRVEEPSGRTYIIQVNGETREVTESQYKQLEAKGLIEPVATVKTLKEPKEEVKPEESSKVESELPEFFSLLPLDEIVAWIELPPEEFVEQISNNDVPSYQFLLEYLSKTTYDDIVKIISPYKDNSQVSYYIERLLSEEGKVWLEQVIALIKEKASGQ